ncbi:MAG TPA: PilZ domain-containing protein [Nitrospira sp.]|nr:PilZ domain-containing protein [Nitrospira sp.]
MDLRRQQRFPIQFRSILSDPRQGEWAGTVKNLSKGGCLIETDGQVYAGMHLLLRLDVPGETTPLLIDRAAVRWSRGQSVGVGFITVASPHKERLDQFLRQLKASLPS